MADERNRWLDEAAADRLLRGEPAEPVGPAADPRARMQAARLRAALDALESLGAAAEPSAAGAGAELPGEAAAVAAFRAAHGPAVARPGAAASGEPLVGLVEISRTAPARVAPRRGRTVSFGLAAALASVAVGGLAAAAGAGLLERARHDTAGPGPAMSVSAGETPVPGTGTGAPTLTPKLLSSPPPDGSSPTAAPGTPQPPSADGRTAPGTGGNAGTSSGTSTTGGSDKDVQGGQSGAGKDGDRDRDTFGSGDADRDREREREQNRLKAVSLCEGYRTGRLDDDRRERLSRLADGLTRIPDYCKSVLDGNSDGGTRGDSPLRDGPLRATTLERAIPLVSAAPGTGR
ncbi:hypothetical protein OG756_24195 [Streptomyces sp. NBC_01310]|uniref:hypothetical protein n=1 Tax=Streptomyces sp. NBC_01310 TaxID=2903820 RepID=UPI0035B66F73|nr:hypothetical protein OG756_24195 [Streptomyces sp. NBC_01310]